MPCTAHAALQRSLSCGSAAMNIKRRLLGSTNVAPSSDRLCILLIGKSQCKETPQPYHVGVLDSIRPTDGFVRVSCNHSVRMTECCRRDSHGKVLGECSWTSDAHTLEVLAKQIFAAATEETRSTLRMCHSSVNQSLRGYALMDLPSSCCLPPPYPLLRIPSQLCPSSR